MTGVSWGQYQDYLYGRFDGINHEDEAQTDRAGKRVSHGGDVYYMCPGENFGKFLCVGVQRALDAGAEAIHLEEPEFWVRSGYSEGFKWEWRNYFHEDWQPPHSSADAQWRASKLKYFLYRRALQQVFAFIQDYNHRSGRRVRCYVPTHSLINHAHWRIVSPESSLAQLDGCDGYIAQVWTGTSRTPNMYRGQLLERTFETAFLEYGAMQNLVRATGRTVWYLNDPIEDNLRLPGESDGTTLRWSAGKRSVVWVRNNPIRIAASEDSDAGFVGTVKQTMPNSTAAWRETNHLLLRRGPYLIAAGLDESISGDSKELHGNFVNLFDPELRARNTVQMAPGSRFFLLDLDAAEKHDSVVLASVCKTLPLKHGDDALTLAVEGVVDTPAIVLLRASKAPETVTLDGRPTEHFKHTASRVRALTRGPNSTTATKLLPDVP